jgi:hypothetical protein
MIVERQLAAERRGEVDGPADDIAAYLVLGKRARRRQGR